MVAPAIEVINHATFKRRAARLHLFSLPSAYGSEGGQELTTEEKENSHEAGDDNRIVDGRGFPVGQERYGACTAKRASAIRAVHRHNDSGDGDAPGERSYFPGKLVRPALRCARRRFLGGDRYDENRNKRAGCGLGATTRAFRPRASSASKRINMNACFGLAEHMNVSRRTRSAAYLICQCDYWFLYFWSIPMEQAPSTHL